MSATVTAAAISAGAALAGTTAQGISVGKANRRGIKLAREQMRWQEKMQDKTNAYNSPENQSELYKAAGLNPAYIYGQSGVDSTASNVSNPNAFPQQQVPNYDFSGVGHAAEMYMEGELRTREMELKKTELDIMQQKADTEKLLADANVKEIASRTQLNEQTVINLISQNAETIERTNAIKAQIKGYELDNQQKALDWIFNVETFQDRVQQLKKQLKLTDAQIDEFYAKAREAAKHADLLDVEGQIAVIKAAVDAATSGATISILTSQSGITETDEKYNEADKYAGYISSLVGAAGNALDGYLMYRLFKDKHKVNTVEYKVSHSNSSGTNGGIKKGLSNSSKEVIRGLGKYFKGVDAKSLKSKYGIGIAIGAACVSLWRSKDYLDSHPVGSTEGRDPNDFRNYPDNIGNKNTWINDTIYAPSSSIITEM